jgi:hypothetical protein
MGISWRIGMTKLSDEAQEIMAAFDVFFVTHPEYHKWPLREAMMMAYAQGRRDSCDTLVKKFNELT